MSERNCESRQNPTTPKEPGPASSNASSKTPRPPPSLRSVLGLWNVDILVVGWALLVVVVTALFRNRITYSKEIVTQHATYVVLYLVMLRVLARLKAGPFIATFARFLAVIAIPFVTFLKLRYIITGLHPQTYELSLLRADMAIFGRDPLKVLQYLLHPLVVDVLEAAYFSYFVTPLVVAAFLFAKKDFRTLNRLYLAVLFALFGSWIGYVILPARSPYLAETDPALAWAFSYERPIKGLLIGDFLRATLDSWDTVKYNAFPSGHTALAVVFISILRKAKGLRLIVIPAYSALILSTVYLRYHFVVDVLAGGLLGLVAVWASKTFLDEPQVLLGSPLRKDETNLLKSNEKTEVQE